MSSDKNSKKKLIILCPYPLGGAPSQRFRYEQYLSILKDYGYEYRIYSFLNTKTNRILYRPGHSLQKLSGIILGYLRRIKHLGAIRRANAVLIHREATPLGPPLVEWIIAKVLKKPIIIDFDDAIWLEDKSGVNRWISQLKWRSKVANVFRWSYSVSAGNAYLAEFGRQHNPNTLINPTTIDTEHYHNQLVNQDTSFVTIGWTGSHSTLKYLTSIVQVLKQLAQNHTFRFVVIANRPPELDLPNLDFIKWAQSTEVEDLMKINIGIMPLPDDSWAQGKCGFKALQYLALGIPAVVSPVGVNQNIVQNGVHGYHAITNDEWYNSLAKLLVDAQLRKNMGQAGQKQVVDHYSVVANTPNFMSLLP
ncbi:glycosyltransferase family 4 protein [Tunicatimonas pelagia]|uniref:glycosyltransferase family 4 protein n=1 Tax=Tunicatimonas pelagia TaxID=931531 RepID=UPI00266611A3|nr:glycosyltransferase family 4 protein [Tunicatimonas pelagia]WKN42824.1 glycosyltransferase family 4 protein [Tunicatimonas pelagia]